MISNELLEEIIYISLKNKFLSKDIVKKIFYQLFDQLDDITKKNFNAVLYEEIDRKNQILGICYDQLGVIKYDLFQMYIEEMKNKDLNMLKKNLNILSTIIHELKHLQEPAKMMKNNLEAKLLKASNVDFGENGDEPHLYVCTPSEKIAYATSWESLLKNVALYPNFSEKYFDEYAFINNEYINHLKLGYIHDEFKQKFNIPLLEYLVATNQLKLFTQLCKVVVADNKEKRKSNLLLEERLKYGLSVTQFDIDEINKKKILTKSAK